MLRKAVVYAGLLLTLFVANLYPRLEILPLAYMLLPMLFLSEKELGLRNFRRGALYGMGFVPLMVLFPPDLSCPAWVLNQLGIATAEEVFFRGYLMKSFGNLGTSLLFSLAHLVSFPTVNSVLVFFPSLVFGWAYLRSGSLLAPVLLHWSANLIYFSFIEKFPQLHQLLQRQLAGG